MEYEEVYKIRKINWIIKIFMYTELLDRGSFLQKRSVILWYD